MMDPFQNNMATQFGRFRILFRKSFIENVYINILKNQFFCNSFYLIIFLKHLRCFFTNAYGVRICSACGGNDTGYPHDGRADNTAYRHDRRADKRRYPHDREIDIQMLKNV